MFKSILKACRIFKYEYVQIWAPIVALIITIIWGFWGLVFETDIPYWKNWENACVFSTLIYTAMLFTAGFFGDKFRGGDSKVDLKKVGIIVLLLLGIVIFAFFIGKENLLLIDVSLCRIQIMFLYLLISLLYLKINFVLVKANTREKDEIKNSILYCEGPISFTFFILFAYAYFLGTQKIDELKIDSFFSGAIAFQMILSNIIWGIMDNSVRIKKCKLIKEYTGG